MYKKSLLWLLIPVFLLATAGVTVTSVFCKGELFKSGISVDSCCKKGDCCKKESQFLKVKDDFQKSFTAFKLLKPLPHTASYLFQTDFTDSLEKQAGYACSNAPPVRSISLNILFCSFLI